MCLNWLHYSEKVAALRTGCPFFVLYGNILWQALLLDLIAVWSFDRCVDTRDAFAGTTIFSKAVVVPGQAVQPECKIPPFAEYGGIKIPTPCLFSGLWP
jgi:hypothetical protein